MRPKATMNYDCEDVEMKNVLSNGRFQSARSSTILIISELASNL
jgi:hypothetical protein